VLSPSLFVSALGKPAVNGSLYVCGIALIAHSRRAREASQRLRADIKNARTVALAHRARGLARRRGCSLGEAYDCLADEVVGPEDVA